MCCDPPTRPTGVWGRGAWRCLRTDFSARRLCPPRDPVPAPPPPQARPGPRALRPAAHSAPGQPAAPQAFAGYELAPDRTPHIGHPQCLRRLAVLWGTQMWGPPKAGAGSSQSLAAVRLACHLPPGSNPCPTRLPATGHTHLRVSASGWARAHPDSWLSWGRAARVTWPPGQRLPPRPGSGQPGGPALASRQS